MVGKTSQNYKKYTLILLIVTIAALVICAASFALKRDSALAVQGNPEQTYSSHYIPKPTASQENGSTANSSKEPRTVSPSPSAASEAPLLKEAYLVMIANGKIGIFHGESPTPILTSDLDLSLLPKEDLSLLEKGIPAASFSEARSILEDYE